jgi:hypothetical protein
MPEAVAAILLSALSSQVKKTNDLVFFEPWPILLILDLV